MCLCCVCVFVWAPSSRYFLCNDSSVPPEPGGRGRGLAAEERGEHGGGGGSLASVELALREARELLPLQMGGVEKRVWLKGASPARASSPRRSSLEIGAAEDGKARPPLPGSRVPLPEMIGEAPLTAPLLALCTAGRQLLLPRLAECGKGKRAPVPLVGVVDFT